MPMKCLDYVRLLPILLSMEQSIRGSHILLSLPQAADLMNNLKTQGTMVCTHV